MVKVLCWLVIATALISLILNAQQGFDMLLASNAFIAIIIGYLILKNER